MNTWYMICNLGQLHVYASMLIYILRDIYTFK